MYSNQEQINKLKAAAIKEIKLVGFRHASLRKICEAAGVSTGYLYSHFKDKDALFNSLVSGFARDLEEKIYFLFDKYHDDYSADSPIYKEQDIVRYLYAHKDAVILLINHAGGTDYEDFKEKVFQIYLKEFIRFYKECVGDDDPDFLSVMCRMRYQSYVEIIRRNLSLEDSLTLAKRVGEFKAAGLYGLKLKI